LAPGSPRIDLDRLNQWLAIGANLPEAESIAALAMKRGATELPLLPQPQTLAHLPEAPRRNRPHDIADGTMPATVSAAILEQIKADNPDGAKLLLDGVDATLSADARGEWRQKVAWSFYIENRDADAYALAVNAATGAADPAQPAATPAPPQGGWSAEAWWTAGLAAWRVGDCAEAGDAFARAANSAGNPALVAASLYWQSRSLVRCREPEHAEALLRAAAAYDETMYGMLASEQLGMKLPATHAAPDFTEADWQRLRDNDNVRAAVALAEIGEDGLADEVLRHQARIGDAALYEPLSRLARDLGLPATQLWMAYNAPSGGMAQPASRYPTPNWTPIGGWQIDPALIYAHTLQESVFRVGAVSPAGARGLMQIMPAAARDHAAELGIAGTPADLTNPQVNLAMGQMHLAALRASPATQGLLPKVIAAYNAGPLPVARWNTEIHDGGDPLLWIESVPYWETRGYIATVLRNYWMYERQAGGPSESREALAAGLWPTFPGLAGSRAVRVAGNDRMYREVSVSGD
ncbi:MAG: lytic transglycosylase domain-containing protein, partial [Sphingomonadales bacterium]|nr:lytic transglycosylase domain-containing protein [Sphingomonadales bacterium]